MIFRFSEIVGRLKKVDRSGWVTQAEIDEPESVADHSFRCAILAMCIGDLPEITADIDVEKLIRMMLLHDIQEALIGDHDNQDKERLGIPEVKRREREGIKRSLSLLPSKLEEDYLTIWREYNNGESREAVLARDIDVLEMIMQALEYEEAGYDPDKLQRFWTDIDNKIQTPIINGLLAVLKRKREDVERGY